MSRTALPLVISRDSREPPPPLCWDFDELPVVVRCHATGDYSADGYETELALERKAEGDYLAAVTFQRERVEREMERLAEFRRAAVIVECSFDDIVQWNYRSRVNPSAVVGTIASWHARYNVPTFFAGSKRNAEIIARRLIEKFVKHLGPKEAAA